MEVGGDSREPRRPPQRPIRDFPGGAAFWAGVDFAVQRGGLVRLLTSGGVYDVTITVGKVGAPVTLAWDVLIAEPSEAPSSAPGKGNC